MSLFSLQFIIFWLVTASAYYLVPKKHKVQNAVLLAANTVFYLFFNIPLFFFLLAEIAFSFFAARKISSSEDIRVKRRWMIGVVAVELFALLFFKYFNMLFASSGIAAIFNDSVSDAVSRIIVPLGISFFTLKIISYTVDIYKNKYKCENSFWDYYIYVSFFPQISSGPIERADGFLAQLKAPRKASYDQTVFGLKTVLWGLFKKMVIADNLAVIVNRVYNDVGSYTGPVLFLATVFFSVQLYCDFSGYSDISVGLSSLLGFRQTDNFKSPYMASNIKEFWDRWHISLSTFFRDYIYFPLGGSRVSLPRNIVNVMIVFLVSGLWHGSTWQFIIWGGINGIYLVIYNIFRKKIKPRFTDMRLFGKIDCVILNFLAVSFAWIFFRSNTLEDAGYIISNIFSGWKLSGLLDSLTALGVNRAFLAVQISSMLILLVNDIVQYKHDSLLIHRLKTVPGVFVFSLLLIAFIFTFGYYGPTADAQPFIYMNF